MQKKFDKQVQEHPMNDVFVGLKQIVGISYCEEMESWERNEIECKLTQVRVLLTRESQTLVSLTQASWCKFDGEPHCR